MSQRASELARLLALQAEAVCHHYLPHGKRHGRYWIVGNVQGEPGRSLYVRLSGHNAGRWRDSATNESGDHLDLIKLNQGHLRFPETLAEARTFLNAPNIPIFSPSKLRISKTIVATRLFTRSKPISGTLAETYLCTRGISLPFSPPALRFHPSCFYRPDDTAPLSTWPALITVITDHQSNLTGVHRTYLARDGMSKAPIETPRRAMGRLHGHGVRFDVVSDVLAVGEGLETTLSVLSLFPNMPMMATLSAANLAAISFPSDLCRLYILQDNDAAGRHAVKALERRARSQGIETYVLTPQAKDFNDDLRILGPSAVIAQVIQQLAADDAERFLS